MNTAVASGVRKKKVKYCSLNGEVQNQETMKEENILYNDVILSSSTSLNIENVLTSQRFKIHVLFTKNRPEEDEEIRNKE